MKRYKFKAKIQPGDGGGAFVFFPFDVEKEFGTKGKVPVEGAFDNVPYKSSIFRYGFPQHLLGIDKATREKINKGPGDSVEVILWKDGSERLVEVPAEFEKRMEKENLLSFFETLSYTHRKEYVQWITEAKKEETRRARFEKAIELLKKNVKTPL